MMISLHQTPKYVEEPIAFTVHAQAMDGSEHFIVIGWGTTKQAAITDAMRDLTDAAAQLERLSQRANTVDARPSAALQD